MTCDVPLGIQLGATTCAGAVYRHGRVVLVEGADGERALPAVVGVREDGRVVVGNEALDLSRTRPERAITDFLRYLGRQAELELAGHRLDAALLVSLLLAQLKARAEAFLGTTVDDCVIAVPSRFDERQRRATLRAASLAGLDVVRLVEEPLAAAWSHWSRRPSAGFSLVLDLGGRNFDVSVIESSHRDSRLVGVDGTSVGGEAYTDRLLDWALRQQGLHLELAELVRPGAVARLRSVLEAAKHALCEPDAGRVPILCPALEDGAGAWELELDPQGFAVLSHNLTERLRRPILRSLRDASLDPLEVREVLLLGGACPMHAVYELVEGIFGGAVTVLGDPGSAVVRGAALQAARLTGALPPSGEVSPATFGLEVTREVGGQTLGGYFLPLLPHGTPLPAFVQEEVETAHEGQTQVFLRFFLGESTRVARNRLLGELDVQGLAPAPAGQALRIAIHWSEGDLIAIEVCSPEGGENARHVFHASGRQATPSECRTALAAFAGAGHPLQDELDDRRLIRFAEQTLTLLALRERWWLEQVLDTFREVAGSGPRNTARLVRADLLGLLEELGYAYRREALGDLDGSWRGFEGDFPEEGAA